jgi:4-hydroxy-tetrahydrodipicolinate synthase
MSSMQWVGIITGVVTPFRADGEIDWESLERHLAHLCGSQIRGVLTSAMMGEGGHLSSSEREAVLNFTVDRVGDRLPAIATIYGNNTREAAEEARRAAQIGAKALLIFPHPAFAGVPLEPELPATYFRAIWDAARLPMMVFRTPDSLAPKFGLNVLQKLIEIPGVAAIKDSAAERDFYTGDALSFLRKNSDVKVLIDCDPHMLEFLRMGADGATSICAALYPEEYVRIMESRDTDRADGVMEVVRPFADLVFSAPFRNFRGRLKSALALRGIIANDVLREPLLQLSPSERVSVEKALRQVDSLRSQRSPEAA